MLILVISVFASDLVIKVLLADRGTDELRARRCELPPGLFLSRADLRPEVVRSGLYPLIIARRCCRRGLARKRLKRDVRHIRDRPSRPTPVSSAASSTRTSRRR